MAKAINMMTQDETDFLRRCRKSTRIGTMDALVMIQNYSNKDNAEAVDRINSLLEKLEKMSDEEFSALQMDSGID